MTVEESRLRYATAPIFRATLTLLDEVSGGQEVSAERFHEHVLRLFRDGQAIMGGSAAWGYASYALACWIDEVLLEHPWQGGEWWQNNILEMELFHSRDCSERFFSMAKQAREVDEEAFAVFYDCVVLGFQGLFNSPEGSELLRHQLGLPDTIQAWLEQNQPVSASSPPTRDLGDRVAIHGAPPNYGHKQVIWWSFATVALLILNVLVFQI